MGQYSIRGSSRQWNLFVKASFAVAILSMLLKIYMLPGSMVSKGYFLISTLLIVCLKITLSTAI
ncbi:MAG: hypothetical protein ACJAUG_000709 [Halioglobus sp.]|jgi:hypothetical protein